MKKAVLEIHFPSSCDDCFFCKKQYGNYWCYVLEENVDYEDWGIWYESRHPECRLKIVEMPEEAVTEMEEAK